MKTRKSWSTSETLAFRPLVDIQWFNTWTAEKAIKDLFLTKHPLQHWSENITCKTIFKIYLFYLVDDAYLTARVSRESEISIADQHKCI